MRELPWMGLGLSSNASATDRPNPYRLLSEQPKLFDFVEYSAPLAIDRAEREASLFPTMLERRAETPLLFHPGHLNLYGPELEPPEVVEQLRQHAEAVGSPWVGNDVGWWHVEGRAFPGYVYLAPPLDPRGLDSCVAHAVAIQEKLGVPLALENPTVMARRGSMHVLDFMAMLHQRTGSPLLLDLGHLFAHQLACRLPPLDGLDRFPLDQVIEIHIAGGVVTRQPGRAIYVDDHTQAVREELFEMLANILPKCTRLRALTFEGDGHPERTAAQTLLRLRGMLDEHHPSPDPRAAVPQRKSGAPQAGAIDPGRPWELFEKAYGARRDSEDSIGSQLETEFRLTVVAEQLDQICPLTRLLLAGTVEDMQSFTASPEFREMFQSGGKELSAAFAAFARRKVREQKDEGLAGVLALEIWAVGLNGKRSGGSAEPGRLALGNGVAAGTFAADFSELLFAAHSLRRHLGSRAFYSAKVDGSAFEVLRQVALRAPQRPWPVVVRRHRQGVELLEVSPELRTVMSLAAEGATEAEAAERAGAEAVRDALSRGLVRVA
jgi:uncharacterized protein (UPF0276 family)